MNLWFLLKLQDYLRFGWKGADVLQTTPKAPHGMVAWTSQGCPFACIGPEGRVCNRGRLPSPEKQIFPQQILINKVQLLGVFLKGGEKSRLKLRVYTYSCGE